MIDAKFITGPAWPNEPRASDKARIVRMWQHYYEERGYGLWGFSPSPAARILADAILKNSSRRSERVEIVDWGCGYGRDSLYFLEFGFDVIGIDVSRKAVALARAAYMQRQRNGIPLIGSASFHAGDLRSVFKSRVGQKVCAFFSNRVLHLLSETAFCEVMREAIGYLEQGAYFCVSARSRDDFDSSVMEWFPGREQELARYKDPVRDGHEIAFVTRERFLQAVGQNLTQTTFLRATEPERVGALDTHLLVMLGRTRVEPCPQSKLVDLANTETALTSVSKGLVPRGRRPQTDVEGVMDCEVAHRPLDFDMPSSAFVEPGATCRSI